MNSKRSILVVENDDLIRELLARWLEEVGYRVIVQHEGVRVRREAPVLVIANLPSPQDAYALIQSLQAAHAAPILALSARFRRGLGASAEAARRLGVQCVLPKPFTRKELLCAVRKAMEGTR